MAWWLGGAAPLDTIYNNFLALFVDLGVLKPFTSKYLVIFHLNWFPNLAVELIAWDTCTYSSNIAICPSKLHLEVYFENTISAVKSPISADKNPILADINPLSPVKSPISAYKNPILADINPISADINPK